MATNLWTRLWAREFDPDEIPAGTIATFVKAPRREGSYGLADALIAGLDRLPLTHAGLVIRSSSVTEIVHSTLDGVRREPLRGAARPHRHGPIFLFRSVALSDDTVAAVLDEAIDRADDIKHPVGYPRSDMLLAALLLRVRNSRRFDEHLHRHLAELFATVVDVRDRGRMCAAFICDVFAAVGAPLALPDERSAFDEGIVDSYETVAILPPWALDGLSTGLTGLAEGLIRGLEHSSSIGSEERDAAAAALRSVATEPDIARSLATWVNEPPEGYDDVHPVVWQLIDALRAHELDGYVPRANRFATVHDIVRSPDVHPLGHCIGWRSDNAQDG